MRRVAIDSQFQEPVVFWVPALPESDRDCHILRLAEVCRQKLEPLAIAHIGSKFFPTQHIVEFAEDGLGNQQPAKPSSRVKGTPWL